MLSYFALLVFPACLLLAACYDAASFRIPNWIPATLAATYIPSAILAGLPWSEIGLSILLFVGFLVLGMGLFALRWFGGGDSKLLAAAAPWIGIGTAFDYVIFVALAGGLLAAGLLMFRKTPLPATIARPWVLRLHSDGEGIPYGVALAAAGIILYPHTAFYQHMVN